MRTHTDRRMHEHTVICGFGRVGREVAEELAARHLPFVVIDLNKRSTHTSANVPLRGVDDTVLQVHDEVKITSGRMFQFGTNEIIIGKAATNQFENTEDFNSDRLRWYVAAFAWSSPTFRPSCHAA